MKFILNDYNIISGPNMRLNYESIKGKRRKESRVPLLLASLYAERTRARINNDSEKTKEITKIKSVS
jgi:hypothetical protein